MRIPIPATLTSAATLAAATYAAFKPISPWSLLILVVSNIASWGMTLAAERAEHRATIDRLDKLAATHARELGYAMRLEARMSSLAKTHLLPTVVWVSLLQLERVCRLSEVGNSFARDTWAKAKMAFRYQIRGYQDAEAHVWPLPEPLPAEVAAELGGAHVERSRCDFLR